MARAKTLLETDTDTVGESFSIDDTILEAAVAALETEVLGLKNKP